MSRKTKQSKKSKYSKSLLTYSPRQVDAWAVATSNLMRLFGIRDPYKEVNIKKSITFIEE